MIFISIQESAAKKQLTVKAKKGGDSHDWLDPYSNECESAFLKSKKESDEKYRTSFDDYKYAEYPTNGIKKTKTKPAISWSENPKFTTKFLTRKEIFDEELPGPVEQIIKGSEGLKSADEIMKQADCVSEESFLNESVNEEKEFVAVAVAKELVEQQEEVIPELDKKKKKKKNKKKVKEAAGGGGKVKKEKNKKKKRKKDKKGKTEEVEKEAEEQVPSESEVKKKRKRNSDQNEAQEEVAKKHRKKRDDSDDGEDSPTKKQKKKKKKRKKNSDSGEEHVEEREDDASPLQVFFKFFLHSIIIRY